MSLSDDAVRGVTFAIEPALPEPKPLTTYAEVLLPEVSGRFDVALLNAPYKMIGSVENPYSLVVPRWLEERVQAEENMTAQEYVNKNWLVNVKVTVV